MRGCNVHNMNPEKADGLNPELQAPLQPLLVADRPGCYFPLPIDLLAPCGR
jgi:hypothetical protein